VDERQRPRRNRARYPEGQGEAAEALGLRSNDPEQ
jgi:hypothetical protein